MWRGLRQGPWAPYLGSTSISGFSRGGRKRRQKMTASGRLWVSRSFWCSCPTWSWYQIIPKLVNVSWSQVIPRLLWGHIRPKLPIRNWFLWWPNQYIGCYQSGGRNGASATGRVFIANMWMVRRGSPEFTNSVYCIGLPLISCLACLWWVLYFSLTAYENWWLPPEEVIVVKKKPANGGGAKQAAVKSGTSKVMSLELIFVTYSLWLSG